MDICLKQKFLCAFPVNRVICKKGSTMKYTELKKNYTE